jgi:glutamate synthase domain-containing protein 3
MTGGIAFVLDETGEFTTKLCNRSGVDVEPVTGPADMQAVENLVSKHFEATGSPRAKWILENWSEMLSKFVKVFPHEYKRVLGVGRFAAQAAHATAPPPPQQQPQTEALRG